MFHSSFFRIRLNLSSPLFPYTTLFRSIHPLACSCGLLDGIANAETRESSGETVEPEINDRRFARFRIGNPDRKSTRLNSSHVSISYAVFCLKKKTKPQVPSATNSSSLS